MKIDFENILERIAATRDCSFSGCGLVLYNKHFTLQQYHCDLVATPSIPDDLNHDDPQFISFMRMICSYHHPYHDGFHLLHISGYLTHIAQYFSPPLLRQAIKKPFHGARYFTAQCGVMIPGVEKIGVISSSKKIHIFSAPVLQVRSNVL